MKNIVVFTDLDGTLLDYSTYSFESALPALKALKEAGIPLVICSSKTKKEIEYYRERLENRHPFISENGGGIFIPVGYFDFDVRTGAYDVAEYGGYCILRLGAFYSTLRKSLGELRSEGFPVRGFGDMTIEEVAALAGLSTEEAAMAKERYFDEPFILTGGDIQTKNLRQAIEKKGLNFEEGRFFHLVGGSDKGRAVSILTSLFRRQLGSLKTLALGDGPNDIPMLREVDYPVVVQRPDGGYDSRIEVPNLIRADGIGPRGWNQSVMELIGRI
jgi:mannosyl-3-phosphoglycerate phosphatase